MRRRDLTRVVPTSAPVTDLPSRAAARARRHRMACTLLGVALLSGGSGLAQRQVRGAAQPVTIHIFWPSR